MLCVGRLVYQWCLLFLLVEATALADVPEFETSIAPLISAKCVECHHPQGKSGGLDLTTLESMLQGGESGPAINRTSPADSLLLQRIEAGEMPPEVAGKPQKLRDGELALLRDWVHGGALWPAGRRLDLYEHTNEIRAGRDWWAFQTVKRPPVPTVTAQEEMGTPVDAFVLESIREQNLSQAPLADRHSLVRRVYFDLLGLPPTDVQIEDYVSDESPRAFERLIDRLLASPRYGERWGRYWLDVVRYAETCGYERDQLKPGIWKYRDWVIGAHNSDLPYDQFVTHQLAGDEIDGRDEQSVIATGMIRAGTWNDEPNDPEDYLYERLEDMVDTTCSAFLGLTLKCARCHDHKFDPLPQIDYYRIASVFWPGPLGQANLGGPTKEELGYDVFGWTDNGPTAEPIRLLIKGERSRPGDVVEPGFLSAIPDLDRPMTPPAANRRTTQRRLQLARWMTDPRHPLTARVLVNRLWLHHFGEGIVRSVNNFGFKSDPPTHPQLLDWLASEFMHPTWESTSGRPVDTAVPWTIKRMHKLIMLSRTYQQSTRHPLQEEYQQRDSSNRYWWHFNRQRMDAEALRDAILTVSGCLNERLGGESFTPSMSPEALEGLSRKGAAWTASPPEEQHRRSIYMMTVRSRILPMMTVFDFCDTTRTCGQRDVTTVAPQALALLNNEFIHQQSEQIAHRIQLQAGANVEQQVMQAWRIVLGRAPEQDELSMGVMHLQQQTTHFRKTLATSNLELQDQQAQTSLPASSHQLTVQPVLWLKADVGVDLDEAGRVIQWRDLSRPTGDDLHHASQTDPSCRPLLLQDAIGGRPALQFDGVRTFLNISGQVLKSAEFSLLAVATHRGRDPMPREILSNWSREGRSTSSVFLGTIGPTGVRLSDAFGNAGQLREPATPFVLTGIASLMQSESFQNDRSLATGGGLGERDVRGPYVIGTQGNFGSEFWDGEIAEVIVFDTALTEDDRRNVWTQLMEKYSISGNPRPVRVGSPEELALESLCLVLLNTNEFIYVD